MKTLKSSNLAGFTIIELLMVFVMVGALTSIAIPQYASYSVKARAAHCLANRYHIEMDERKYFLDHDSPSLKIDDLYKCPCGGEYVWLVSDPNDPDYPKVGCSIHFWPGEDEEDKEEDKKEDKKEKKVKNDKKVKKEK